MTERSPYCALPALSALDAAIRDRQGEQWLNDNRAALEAYNEHFERDGVFSDGLRTF